MMRRAKKQQFGGTKSKATTVVGVASATAGCRGGRVVVEPKGESEIADIFAAMREKLHRDGCRSRIGGDPIQRRKDVKTASQCVSDGLYHAPEKTLELSDSAFFDVASQRQQKKRKANASTATEFPEEVLRREGVDRIVTLEELRGITSSNPKAGTTANCPFDCDCCF
ncbi:hypothetical protein C3747_1g88 [Trypanosoma cruzi]|uniref:Uncharacterized protein n=2 Tax=Trypanosoma cruzi TaxID=5693 RepID=Q4D6U1_TRYCC|nr:hypothetical protein, conserved [Trypanosoma cruzi]EAN88248.1 hypothetical protein, conserved [Trypanosoma cruzi]PWV21872.1 hypothetical protein C3747_1g88 [Trypanosoma cruzi]RNC50225.1 hypothetical protein TcCL_ESM12743 [Trypanosoma cruzi]|eukprot:XP_810099.1 hypothetical protein [Trypanosoma cruzi strain CL Brener]